MQRLVAISTVAIVLAASSFAYAGAPFFTARTTTIPANSRDVYTVTFVGGQYGQVRVHSYGSTFLVVGVYDNDGNLLEASIDKYSDALVNFYASYTGAYRIVVVNAASIANPYYISTN